MTRRNDVFAVFYNDIGDNLTNDTDDIISAKRKFQELGYYKDPIISGYIDKSLVDSINAYQKDKDLLIDGRINPGGETESTIFGDLLGLPKGTVKDDAYDFTIKTPRTIPSLFTHAMAMALPAAAPAIFRSAGAAKKLWDIWRSVPADTRQDDIDQMCDEQYADDVQECRDLANKDQEQRAAVCYESASRRMAKCRKDRSDNDLPPLTK